MKRLITDNRGLTLVELLIATLIMSIVLIAGATLITNGTRGATQVQESAEANRDGQAIAGTMTRSIRNASCVQATDTTVLMQDATTELYLGWWLVPAGDGMYNIHARMNEAPFAPGGQGMTMGTGVRPAGAGIFQPDGAGVRISMDVVRQTGLMRSAHVTQIDTTAVPRFPAPDGDAACAG